MEDTFLPGKQEVEAVVVHDKADLQFFGTFDNDICGLHQASSLHYPILGSQFRQCFSHSIMANTLVGILYNQSCHVVILVQQNRVFR